MTAPDRQQDYLPPSPRAADAGTLHHPRRVLFGSPPRHASAPTLNPTLDHPLVMLTWAAQIHGQCLLGPIHERYLAIYRPLPPLDSDERENHLPRFWMLRAPMLSPLRYPRLPRLVYPPAPSYLSGKCAYSPRIIYYAMLAVYPFPARIPAPCAPIHAAQIRRWLPPQLSIQWVSDLVERVRLPYPSSMPFCRPPSLVVASEWLSCALLRSLSVVVFH
ncbi:hypothetical protein C8R44DRAFT_768417 [Mycena epipterygia]|nr:hypothetical protein C8R44DRAFT_768417 [Mycena epipterygia]